LIEVVIPPRAATSFRRSKKHLAIPPHFSYS
jgi:hypothetical protein